jgi:GT2 family glycosyltransferase
MTQANPISPIRIELPGSPIVQKQTTTALLVLGMHRSGTSALARVLNLMGVELGRDLLPAAPDNEAGFWEHREIQFIHDRIYEDLQRDWTNISPLPSHWWHRPEIQARRAQLKDILQRDFSGQSLWGIKDPRLCFMLPIWTELLAELHCEPKCVLICRNPQEVVGSLQKRDGFTASRTYLLWMRSVIESERNSRGLPRTLTTFDKILGDWQGQVTAIGQSLNIDWPLSPQQVSGAVAEFIRPTARHHSVKDSRFLEDASVPQQVRDLYAALLSAADSGNVDALSPVVDQLAGDLEHSQPLLSEFTADLETENRNNVIKRNIDAIKFSGNIDQLQQQVSVGHSQVAAANSQIEQLTAEQARLQAAALDLTSQLSQTSEQLSSAVSKVEALTAEVAADQQAIRQKDVVIEQFRAQQIDTNRQITRLTEEQARLRAELTQVYRTRDTLGPSLAALWRSPLWKWGWPARALARAMGKLDVGIDQLIPLTEMRRAENGSWLGTQLPMFLIPTSPLKGWVRLRTKIRSAVGSRAMLYFDTGGAFNPNEQFELSPVQGETVIERMVPLRKPTFFIRFDPIQASGEFTVESFSLQPMSRLWFNTEAVLRNLKGMILGGGTHRPSIWRGLKLLLTGDLKKFHGQLVSNTESATTISEYDLWRRRNAITDARRQAMRDTIADWETKGLNLPKISVITPVYNVPETYLRKCIESVIHQVYPHWELCLADDASPKSHVKRVLAEYAAKDSRIKVVNLPVNGGISVASNAAFNLATGDFIALLDHDDEIAEHALFRAAETIVENPTVDVIYSDEDKLTAEGKHLDPFFKPDWSPEYFLACMYTCHLTVYRAELVKAAGGWRKQYDGSQDYDLALRIFTREPRIKHIPDILYHWRTLSTSTASGASAKPQAHYRAQAAIADHLQRIGRKGVVEDGPSPGYHRVRYAILGDPKVSIVIPSACRAIEKDGKTSWLALDCVASIRKLSSYKNLEIIVLYDQQISPELDSALDAFGVRRLAFNEPFNFSSKMNLGCFAAQGTHLVTLNDDVEVITPDWIETMLEYSQWPEIGAVGAQLLFPNNTLQHTGVTILQGNPGHPFYQFPADHPGYFNSTLIHRNWSAVTAACMMTRADVFKSVGGFTEKFPLNYNDVDYCLKVQTTGRRIVYMPYAKLYHHESVTKAGTFAHELEDFKNTWMDRIALDPYYNPNLSMHVGDFRVG